MSECVNERQNGGMDSRTRERGNSQRKRTNYMERIQGMDCGRREREITTEPSNTQKASNKKESRNQGTRKTQRGFY